MCAGGGSLPCVVHMRPDVSCTFGAMYHGVGGRLHVTYVAHTRRMKRFRNLALLRVPGKTLATNSFEYLRIPKHFVHKKRKDPKRIPVVSAEKLDTYDM